MDIFKLIGQVSLENGKLVQMGLATLLLNFSILMIQKDNEEGKITCVNATHFYLSCFVHEESILRCLKALGTLIHEMNDSLKKAVEEQQFGFLVRTIKEKKLSEDIDNCCTLIIEILPEDDHPVGNPDCSMM